MSVKNFEKGLEWIWDKNKFMDRKAEMTEYYLDFKDDGIINRDKFKVKKKELKFYFNFIS